MRDGGKPWPSTQGRAHSRYSVEGGEQLNDGAGGWLKDKQNQSKSASQAGLAKLSSPPSDPQTFRFPRVCLGKGLTWAWVYSRCTLHVRCMSAGILPILGVGEEGGGVKSCFLLCPGARPGSLWPVDQRTRGWAGPLIRACGRLGTLQPLGAVNRATGRKAGCQSGSIRAERS